MRLDDTQLLQLLHDDVPYGDLTTHALGIGALKAQLRLRCRREQMVCACMQEVARLCELGGLHVSFCADEGALLYKGETLVEASGTASAVHGVWKVLQNLVDFTGGIATYTYAMVQAARAVNANAVVATTRKTLPFTKALTIKAVEAGGGVAHRLGLSETLLVFEEHRRFFHNDSELERVLLHVKAQNPEKHLVVEVHSLAEAQKFAAMGADILQLEKFKRSELHEVVKTLQNAFLHVKLIATGGITVENVADYALSGVDIIVTSAPYMAPSADVKVEITAL